MPRLITPAGYAGIAACRQTKFDSHSRRRRFRDRRDVLVTTATYLRASSIAVITKEQLLRTLAAMPIAESA